MLVNLLPRDGWDWARKGRLVRPPRFVTEEMDGFKDGLREIVPTKLKECLVRKDDLKRNKDENLLLISKFVKEGSLGELFWKEFVVNEWEEDALLDKWVKYWLDIWEYINAKELDKIKIEYNDGQWKEDDLQKAMEYPIEDLYPSDRKLRKSGRTLIGKCPFHEERTGSFTIYTDENHWYCYGACQEGGDSISFLMKLKSLDFKSAVRELLYGHC